MDDLKDLMECRDFCIVIMQRIKNYGFIVRLEIRWLNFKKKKTNRNKSSPTAHGKSSSDEGSKKVKRQIFKIAIQIMHRKQQMPLVYKSFPYRDSVSDGWREQCWTSFNKNKSGCLLDYINILRNAFKNGKSSQIWEEQWAHRKRPSTTGRAKIKEMTSMNLLNNCFQQPRPPVVCDLYTIVCTF